MKINQALLTELDEIYELELACFPREAWSRAIFREELSNGRTLYLLAREGEIPVGYIAVAFDQQFHYAHITSLAVMPAFQRRGIASALLEEALIRMTAGGIRHYRAETRVSNDHVLRLFRKFGFAEEMIINRYYQHPVEAAVVLSRNDPDKGSATMVQSTDQT